MSNKANELDVDEDQHTLIASLRAQLDAATVRETALREALEYFRGLTSQEVDEFGIEGKVRDDVRKALSLDPSPGVRLLEAARRMADALNDLAFPIEERAFLQIELAAARRAELSK